MKIHTPQQVTEILAKNPNVIFMLRKIKRRNNYTSWRKVTPERAQHKLRVLISCGDDDLVFSNDDILWCPYEVKAIIA